MSNSIGNVLYLGQNLPLAEAFFNSFAADKKTDNYQVFHLVSGEKLFLTLSENSVSHLISEIPINLEIKDKIKADFPLLKTTYLNPDDQPKETGLSVDLENIFTDEVQVVLESLSIPIYFKNKQAQYLACNRHFSELLGLTPNQVIGKKLADLLDSPLTDAIGKIDQKMFIEHQVCLHEYTWTNPVGEQCDLLFHKECAASSDIQSGLVFDITELNKSQSLLEKERVMLRTTADTSRDIIFFRDLEGLLLSCNKQYEKFTGGLEKDLVGKTVFAFLPLDEAILAAQRDKYIIKNNKPYTWKGFFTAHNNECYFFEIKKSPIQDKDGNVQGVATVGRNLTEQLRMQKRLQITDVVFEHSREALIVTDGDGHIISANDHACFLFGYSKDQLLAEEINLLASDNYNDEYYKNIEQILETESFWQGDITYRTKNGSVYYAWLEVYAVEHVEENSVDRVYSYTDLTHFQVTDKKISFLSKQDPLTGLRNRISLFSRLEDIITCANYLHSAVAVMLIDIDDFKAINDNYGHNAGDKVLKEVAERLTSCVSGKDTLGRYGNDQFIIIIDELVNEFDAAMVANKIAEQFSRAFLIENSYTNLSASIGISLSPDDGMEASTLFLNAEDAMQRGKSDRSAAFNFYTASLTVGLNKEFALEQELQQALLSEQFVMYYQPQYDFNNRQIVALEGLLHWHHPKRGILTLERFLSVAEGSHLLVPIGWEIIHKAALQAVIWEKSEIKFGRIAVNLFTIQLSQISFIAELQTILKETGCSTGQLEFLVDKTVLQHASTDILSNLDNLNKMGITLTITNLGIDANVIDLIHRLGVQNLKISDSQINSGSGILASELQLQCFKFFARSLSLNVVSDGLDNAEQASFVQEKVMSTPEATFYLRCNKRK
ncbi:diguanylate cyclase/phosphodiesterase with PAS/PAC sensor(s) [Psychromonas ingrahamii 37]|uniref:Diguanylate cyclase/phosphodiesterase with PAS/PAC sensor(S) n=1 Tax=Psychromonas ingrahamii (strain DSM 17664 / CCUG 51855 / 37) TaxID=357804 RepID=A1SZT9_PSYIN|nr:diguanylate cyclase [Psychromonas ingrahamii]ABM05004.1 diguanylate cyclase/phosphodiesterase with PAS/PAC sensor(s) [Psychromonas ingrahamii 37]